MKLFANRKSLIAAGVASALAVSGAGVAFGYFTAASGDAPGSAVVGTSSAWTVADVITTGGPLVPGSGVHTVTATVTNPGASTNNLASVVVSIPSNPGTGDVLDIGGASILDCKAIWFTVVDSTPAQLVLGGGTATGVSSTITMPNLDLVDQSACKDATFAISVTASS